MNSSLGQLPQRFLSLNTMHPCPQTTSRRRRQASQLLHSCNTLTCNIANVGASQAEIRPSRPTRICRNPTLQPLKFTRPLPCKTVCTRCMYGSNLTKSLPHPRKSHRIPPDPVTHRTRAWYALAAESPALSPLVVLLQHLPQLFNYKKAGYAPPKTFFQRCGTTRSPRGASGSSKIFLRLS